VGGAAKLELGSVFAGRYEVEEKLGDGDRKRTYLAHDTKLDRQVAISLVKPEAVLADPEGTEREARVLGRIGNHPNIVSLYDFEIDGDGSAEYMIFEYLGGGTLTEYLKQAGQQSLDDVLRFGRQLCRGLSHLHGQGLIHRDVSPNNVWLDERHVAHLGDFDSAITTIGTDIPRPITTGAYAAPEELHGGSLDERSDLYSLGGVLHVIATGGRWPGDLSLLGSQRPDLLLALGDLIASLLSDSPDDRPLSAASVLVRLDDIRHGSKIGSLIAAGESEQIEFKSSLHHPYGPPSPDLQKLQPQQARKEAQKWLRKSVTKTIAAFLNTNGGTLLIGVDDSGAVLGIEADFVYLRPEKQHADGWMLSLKEAIINALEREVWGAIHASVVQHEEHMVAVVHCPPRAGETWHREGGAECFYIRAANATEELTGRDLVRYMREHWPE